MQVLVCESQRKRSLARPNRGVEDTIKMDLTDKEMRMWTGSSCRRIGTTDGKVLQLAST
jgi:hypothetical protein